MQIPRRSYETRLSVHIFSQIFGSHILLDSESRIFQIIETVPAHFSEAGAVMICIASMAEVISNEARHNRHKTLIAA